MTIRARCMCPTHGRLTLDGVVIKNGVPLCEKCRAELQFGDVKPRKIKSSKKKI